MSESINSTWFYQQLGLPEKALLQARIYKKQLLENADLTISDRKWINEDIESIEWRYTLKPATVAIPKYEDAEREYIEIALLHITLKANTHVKRLSEVVQRAIPYPLIVVFEHDNNLWVCLAEKRINRADSSKLTVEQFFESGWLNGLAAPSEVITQFGSSLGFTQLAQLDLYAFYQSIITRFNALEAAKHTGKFALTADVEADKLRQQHLQTLKQLELQLVSLKAQVKNETQFNRKLEGNVQIKQLKQQIQHITNQLSA
jgi:hypothetical protein